MSDISLNNIDDAHWDRAVDAIMGDVVSLITDFREYLDEADTEQNLVLNLLLRDLSKLQADMQRHAVREIQTEREPIALMSDAVEAAMTSFTSVGGVRERLTVLENEWVACEAAYGAFAHQGCYILTAGGVARLAKVEMHPEFGLVFFPEE